MLTQLANLTFVLSKMNALLWANCPLLLCFLLGLTPIFSSQSHSSCLQNSNNLLRKLILTPPNFILNLPAELFLTLFSRHLFSINLSVISCHPLLFHLCLLFRLCAHTHTFDVLELSQSCVPSCPPTFLAPVSFNRILIQSQTHFYCFLFIITKRRCSDSLLRIKHSLKKS